MVNLLVNKHTRGSVQIIVSVQCRPFGGFVFREGICIFVMLCVGQILPNPLQKSYFLFLHAE
jgi:hypothetical protein